MEDIRTDIMGASDDGRVDGRLLEMDRHWSEVNEYWDEELVLAVQLEWSLLKIPLQLT